MANELSLYKLSEQYREALTTLQDMELDEETVKDTLEGLQGNIEVKATNVALFVKNIEALAESIKEAESQMAARRKSIENRAARIREYLLVGMQLSGITKIECPYFKIALRDNPESVIVEDEKLIPSEYFKPAPPPPPPSPDKTAIKKALKEGKPCPGARLEKKQRVEIK